MKVNGNKVFYIHEELLLQRSPYFSGKKQLSLGPGIRCYGAMELEQDSFERYIKFLYTGEIPGKGIAHDTEGQGVLEFYALAETLEDTAAMDLAVDAYLSLYSFSAERDRRGRLPGVAEIKTIYENMWSPLIRLVVDMYVWESDDEDLEGDGDGKVTDFLVDLSRALMQQVRALKGQETNFRTKEQATCCDYHEHDEDDPCPSRKRKREDNDTAERISGPVERRT